MANNETICLLNATNGYSNISPIEYDGSVYDKIFYRYSWCPDVTYIQQLLCPKKHLIACFCHAKDAHEIFAGLLCNAKELSAIQIATTTTALLGIILNITVLSIYVRRKHMQNKVGNILLASQACVDLFNTLMFAFPKSLFYLVSTSIYYDRSAVVSKRILLCILFYISFDSSMSLFTLIGFERYLALSKPLAHRTNVTKKWIIKKLIIVLLLTTVITPMQVVALKFSISFLHYLLCILELAWLTAVSFLFAVSFTKTRECLKRRRRFQYHDKEKANERSGHTHFETRFLDIKMLRLTVIFLSMYGVFLLAIVPTIIAHIFWVIKGRVYLLGSMVNHLTLSMSSMINPILTLSNKTDYFIFSNKGVRNAATTFTNLRRNTIALVTNGIPVEGPRSSRVHLNTI